MNHLSKSIVSLLLAVMLLLGAAGLSFELVFGLPVYAAEGSTEDTSTQKETVPQADTPTTLEHELPSANANWGDATLTSVQADGVDLLKKYSGNDKTFNTLNLLVSHPTTSNISSDDAENLKKATVEVTFTDGNFSKGNSAKIIKSSLSQNQLTYTVSVTQVPYSRKTDKITCDVKITPSSGSLSEHTVNLDAELKKSSTDSSDSTENALKSYGFFHSNGDPISKITRGTYETFRLDIHEPNISPDKFNANKGQISWKINSDVFDVRGKNRKSSRDNADTTLVKGDFSQGKSDGQSGVIYTFTLYNVYYSGISNRLKLYLDYDDDGQTDRIINEVLTECELYQEPPRDPSGDKEESSSSRPEIAPPTPNIIVSEYKLSEGSNVTAARDFSIDLTIKNTSKKLPIDNIVMKVTVPEAFTMTSSSNTFYIDMLPKNSTTKRTIKLSVKPNAEPISHPVKLSFSFEAVIDEARKQFTSDEEISIPVSQLDRFSLNTVEVPPEIVVGEDSSFEVSFINKGKTPVYNITAEITGNVSQPGQRQFLGNLESGKEESADFVLGAADAGTIQGEVVITYEDANMNVSELRSPFQTNAITFEPPPMEPDINAMGQDDTPPPVQPWYMVIYQKLPPWGWMVVGVVLIIFTSFIIKLIRHYRDKKLLMEDDDEDL